MELPSVLSFVNNLPDYQYIFNKVTFWGFTSMASAIVALLIYIYKMNRKQHKSYFDKLCRNMEKLGERLDEVQASVKNSQTTASHMENKIDDIFERQKHMATNINKLFKTQSRQNERIARLEAIYHERFGHQGHQGGPPSHPNS